MCHISNILAINIFLNKNLNNTLKILNNMKTRNDRFRFVLDTLINSGVIASQAELSKNTGLAEWKISVIKSNKRDIKSDEIDLICNKYPQFSRYWFHTGFGNPLNNILDLSPLLISLKISLKQNTRLLWTLSS